ncbi:U46 protein [macacine betaherpesvirus 9]|uniref:U46 protein n=1 Tax=macacine betaherpesvirus 9 TaxID=2560568 RepID=A0A192XPD7_9BETA|nr:U46 protein [macacine betaherpesvirus 9]ANC96592.1 U46 protein [macacine betaherpesvirus 9]
MKKMVFYYLTLCIFFCFSNNVVGETNNFRDANCHSHTYEIVLKSFSSIWILINVFILFCAFSLFLKYWCYKSLAKETVKGY